MLASARRPAVIPCHVMGHCAVCFQASGADGVTCGGRSVISDSEHQRWTATGLATSRSPGVSPKTPVFSNFLFCRPLLPSLGSSVDPRWLVWPQVSQTHPSMPTHGNFYLDVSFLSRRKSFLKSTASRTSPSRLAVQNGIKGLTQPPLGTELALLA